MVCNIRIFALIRYWYNTLTITQYSIIISYNKACYKSVSQCNNLFMHDYSYAPCDKHLKLSLVVPPTVSSLYVTLYNDGHTLCHHYTPLCTVMVTDHHCTEWHMVMTLCVTIIIQSGVWWWPCVWPTVTHCVITIYHPVQWLLHNNLWDIQCIQL